MSDHEEGLKKTDEEDDGEEELEFNDRFKLSKEERRKFWMVKEKKEKITTKPDTVT